MNSFPPQGQSPGQLGMAHFPVSGSVYVWFIQRHVLQRGPCVLHCCQGGTYGKHKKKKPGLACLEQFHLLVILKQRGKHCVCSTGRVIALQAVCSLLKDFNPHVFQVYVVSGLSSSIRYFQKDTYSHLAWILRTTLKWATRILLHWSTRHRLWGELANTPAREGEPGHACVLWGTFACTGKVAQHQPAAFACSTDYTGWSQGCSSLLMGSPA